MTARRAPTPGAPEVLLITGLSGAGRSETAKVLEDLGWFVVDNLPPSLIPKMTELGARPGGPQRIAVVADVRGGVFFEDLAQALTEVAEAGVGLRVLFLEASDDVLVNRYEASRHRHPLAPGDRILDGVRAEREVMVGLRGQADIVIDTSELSPHDLRVRIRDAFGGEGSAPPMAVSLVSFGFKYGPPRDADLVLDCRFLPNPHWIDALRPLPGTDERVGAYVRGQQTYREFLRRLRALLGFMLPGFVAEGKSYLTIAVGCTGGRHRSVVVTEDLARFFRDKGLPASTEHRDIDR